MKQSYLETKTTAITPFIHSKMSINLSSVVKKGNFDKKKQMRALMPNLIHSLDGTWLILFYEMFSNSLKDLQILSVHDCFGTTCDKVSVLKTILAPVYIDLYSSDPYLYKFDKNILDNIQTNISYKMDSDTRVVKLKEYNDIIHDIYKVNGIKKNIG